jgi:hypothetical protein
MLRLILFAAAPAAALSTTCDQSSFTTANNWQCDGLSNEKAAKSATDAKSCAAACCAESKCEVWQWCADNTVL